MRTLSQVISEAHILFEEQQRIFDREMELSKEWRQLGQGSSDALIKRLRDAKLNLHTALSELRAAARKAEQSRVLKFTKWDFKGSTKLLKLV